MLLRWDATAPTQHAYMRALRSVYLSVGPVNRRTQQTLDQFADFAYYVRLY